MNKNNNDSGNATIADSIRNSELNGALEYEISTRYTGVKMTCRDVVKKLVDSGGNIRCMGELMFIDPVYPNEVSFFETSWDWIQARPGSKLLIVVLQNRCIGRVV